LQRSIVRLKKRWVQRAFLGIHSVTCTTDQGCQTLTSDSGPNQPVAMRAAKCQQAGQMTRLVCPSMPSVVGRQPFLPPLGRLAATRRVIVDAPLMTQNLPAARTMSIRDPEPFRCSYLQVHKHSALEEVEHVKESLLASAARVRCVHCSVRGSAQATPSHNQYPSTPGGGWLAGEKASRCVGPT